MTKAWYYSQGGRREGPVPFDELKDLARRGRLRSTDLVWEEGTADWIKASMVGGLFADGGGADEPMRRRRPEERVKRDRGDRPRDESGRAEPLAKPGSRGQMIALFTGIAGLVIVGIVFIVIAVANRGETPADPPVAKGPATAPEPPTRIDPPVVMPPAKGGTLVTPASDPPKTLPGGFTQLDLRPFINWRRGDGIQVKGNDLGNLPDGPNTLAGVPFNVQGGAVVLGGSVFARDRPLAASGIVVNRRLKNLHALHLAHFPATPGAMIGAYVLRYQDGSSAELPIVYGEHVSDWWKAWTPPAGVTRLAWTGSNLASPDIRFYATRYSNPAPAKIVASIDFISRNAGSCPCCVALTIEE
ncbi:MAG: DUF4339 domain-containing protein [Gemmataceae bacterium]